MFQPWLTPMTQLSAASGVVWAFIAWFLAHHVFRNQIWGGILLAPAIGILVGRLSSWAHDKPRWIQITWSLLGLYLAAACFAVGVGLLSAFTGPRHVPPGPRVMEAVAAVLWGLTFTGYVLLLWPLSFFNHRLVWQTADGEFPPAPELRITAATVRLLSLAIVGLATAGYLARLLLLIIVSAGSSPSAMPWWISIGLMGWSAWVLLGALVWLLAPVLAFGAVRAARSNESSPATYRDLLGVVGFALLTYPILSFAATLVVMSIKISLVHSWATEGTVLMAPYCYRNVFRAALPSILLGGVLVSVRWMIRSR